MVVSEGVKIRPSERVRVWLQARSVEDVSISVITLGEIWKGAQRAVSSEKRRFYEHWSLTQLPAQFAGRVLPINAAIARAWGAMEAAARCTLPAADTLIAATALTHDLIVATRNERDFAPLGVKVVNPWA